MISFLFLSGVVVLDLVFGDPRWIRHPVTLIGQLALKLEHWSRRFFAKDFLAGIATWTVTVLVVAAVYLFCRWVLLWVHSILALVFDLWLAYSSLAFKSLWDHGDAVRAALEEPNLPLARKRLSMMVGRDTDHLCERAVTVATLESLGENGVDGITAPLFFLIAGGVFGALIYKAVSTLDSMFGYRNTRYRRFGWMSARADDVAACFPARLTGCLIPVAAALLGLRWRQSWRIFFRDRLSHPSPNAAHGEAALAGALGVQLGGPSTYAGTYRLKPHLGDHLECPRVDHICQANRLVRTTGMLFALLFFCLVNGMLSGLSVI